MDLFSALVNTLLLVMLAALYFYLHARRKYIEQLKAKLYSNLLTVSDFCETLYKLGEEDEIIERLDLDRVDVDNFSTALIRLFQRRRERERSWSRIRVWWFQLRGWLFGTRALYPSEQLHLVLIGRRFSSRLSHMVYNKQSGKFDLEIWDGESCKIVEVLPKELSSWVKQASWEEQCWDRKEEELLIGLHAAQLRSCLTSAGVRPWEYSMYHGGFPELAGLSCHVHSLDFEFLENADCSSFVPRSGTELGSLFPAQWRALSVEERRERFHSIATSPPLKARFLHPLSHYADICRKQPKAALVLYLSSPMTAAAETFEHCPDLARRVAYVCAMSAAWDGSKNLLGTCFNNAVDYHATVVCCRKNFFPLARFLLVPTETCKMGPFTITSKTINSLPCHASGAGLQRVLRDSIEQWTQLKRGEPQALFDAVTMIPLLDIIAHAAVVPVEVVFGKNLFSIGTRFEDLGMTLRSQDNENDSHNASLSPQPLDVQCVKGRLRTTSYFPMGQLYATERVFEETCSDVFLDVFRDILC